MPSHFYLEALENPDVYNYIIFIDHDDVVFGPEVSYRH